MAALTRFAVALMVFAAPMGVAAGDAPPTSKPAFSASPAVERWRPYIAEASLRFGVPQAWIDAVMQAESAGQTHRGGRPITSHAGAMGLMQLMPGTWAQMRRDHGLGPDPHDPRDNILAGTAYLRAMHDGFGYPGLFAAYNAGPRRYAEHLRTGRPLAGETRGYIAQLARAPATPSMPPAMLSGTRLFFTLGHANNAPGNAKSTPNSHTEIVDGDVRNAPEQPASSGLFVPLNDPSGGER
ncbi:lytic transglycosylase catalytic subunit [Sphingomonas sp. LH128]|uniref:lytic transglycosylase domain-containing protein n=1 Tax=Sphingomonas sp. LH128 TaxID=473781 RepID=UPI00027CB1EA|nr:lytic transglycosylase domain-containing protein [Sphingomonas sp. LH128]EJU12119.1 lytic transglycosylase catalytic subunit [Sphingomonas sp. LH128]